MWAFSFIFIIKNDAILPLTIHSFNSILGQNFKIFWNKFIYTCIIHNVCLYLSIIIIGCFDSYTVHDQYTQGDGIIHVDTQKEKQCESLCNANSLCQGFRHDTSDDSCELTVGNIAIFSVSSGSRFYQRHCPKGKTKKCS